MTQNRDREGGLKGRAMWLKLEKPCQRCISPSHHSKAGSWWGRRGSWWHSAAAGWVAQYTGANVLCRNLTDTRKLSRSQKAGTSPFFTLAPAKGDPKHVALFMSWRHLVARPWAVCQLLVVSVENFLSIWSRKYGFFFSQCVFVRIFSKDGPIKLKLNRSSSVYFSFALKICG